MLPHRIFRSHGLSLATIALATLVSVNVPRRALADALTDQLQTLATQQSETVPLKAWKFHQPDIEGAERPDFDDAAWSTVGPGTTWNGKTAKVWFRTQYVVPPTINGVTTQGASLRLEVGMDDFVETYVNGAYLGKSHWNDGHVVLADNIHPGETFTIALRGINTNGPTGALHYGRVVYDLLGPIQPAFAQYSDEAQFVEQIEASAPNADRVRMVQTLNASEAQVDIGAIRARDWEKARASLDAARKTLLALAPITRQYDVYYVGHAHIDMNWQWTWPETIDTCHRTWDSAMNLMDQFRDFDFVQSQPAAYVPIQQQYPEEFARMQADQKPGQWDLVGGMWNESDTNLPSGEALARSLFLGQRYFKTNFGRYAETGWLPDSFGHSWQMPQLLQGAGIRSFYHMRCGNSIPLAWWQSPDGSRVLKANTPSYDEKVRLAEMARPWVDQRQNGLKEGLVVFGVGDHGGGPTRDMIQLAKSYQDDPVFPKVHFVTADEYFDRLYDKPERIANLPVVDTDLQYTFVGCYTSHADMKKAVRDSENNLYTGEVFSALAAMNAGLRYPIVGFTEAWKPTAFAQFHDIMCGTAIHSTYDWMHQQLAPAFTFEAAQTDRALQALTTATDTRGALTGETPVVVWNALSSSRSDIVRVAVDDASRWSSARGAVGGQSVPVQAIDAHTIAFIAHDVPAFGHATYFLSHAALPTPPGDLVRETADAIVLENPTLRATLAKNTGLLTSLLDKRSGQEMIAPGQPANLLQVLGDKGSSWTIQYTGEQHDLTTGADVQIVARGPVCSVVRVKHTFGKSTFTQDVTLYNDLPRIDVPTTIEWHEHGQLVKVAFPLSMPHPHARVGIPYGSIDRPTTGQENPGQKWMDVTEVHQNAVTDPTPIDLHALYNNRSDIDFDAQKRAYPSARMPPMGRHVLGSSGVSFQLATGSGKPDNVICAGQTIPLPIPTQGYTLYVLGAGELGPQGGALNLLQADGKRRTLPFHLGDWIEGGGGNEDALALDYRLAPDGTQDKTNKPHLWIAAVPLPMASSVTQITLPQNEHAHIFALSLGDTLPPTPIYGLTVLNDCKYGSDTTNNVFRLTLLRASNKPDPNPDEGTQTFTYSLLPHAGDWRDAGAEQAGLALNIPLRAIVTDAHVGATTALVQPVVEPSQSVVVGALKHAEDGPGYILRVFETQGRDTVAHIHFGARVQVEETDLLERPIHPRPITVQDGVATFAIGHDQIVTLHITGLPDAGIGP